MGNSSWNPRCRAREAQGARERARIMRVVSCVLMLPKTMVKPQSCYNRQYREHNVGHVERARHKVKSLGSLPTNRKKTGNKNPNSACQRTRLLPNVQQRHRAEPNPCSLRERIHRPIGKIRIERTCDNAQLGYEWRCADVVKPTEHEETRRSEGDVNQSSEH
jgi:hypothetical protein